MICYAVILSLYRLDYIEMRDIICQIAKMVFHGSDIEKYVRSISLSLRKFVVFGANVNPLGLLEYVATACRTA